MQIHRLSDDVIDKIAAGEVVERPAHMVKELLENSLDALATHITVEIENGGRNVCVIDDGQGIAKEQLNPALGRHCTSKIQNFDDLWHLNSYGFRGEALATISSVSELTIGSRKSKDTQGFGLTSSFGRLGHVEPIALNSGTRVTVKNLFENVPARLKFMKSASAEVSQIRLVIQALALCHPRVEFTLKVEGKLDFVFPITNSLKLRAEQVLDMPVLFESSGSYGSYQCHALFSSPENVRGNTRGIWLFVQGRWIQDRGLQAAVLDAYRGLLMHGEYPVVAVFLTCDSQEVDVNVHPTKSQVRFRDSKSAFRAVHQTIRSGVEKTPWNMNSTYEPTNTQGDKALSDNIEVVYEPFNSENIIMTPQVEYLASPTQQMSLQQMETGSKEWTRLQLLGQARATYLLTESDNAFVFIDQHAAHERVLYERILQSWNAQPEDIQTFLLPLSISLREEQVEALLSLRGEFAKIGIELDQGGIDSVIVRMAPNWLSETALVKTLEKTAEELLNLGGSFALEKIRRDIAASLACHSAVRAGQVLGASEMSNLLEQMEEFAFSSYCPHGRPVSVEIPWSKLERDFGRIV